ncbi:MAG: hypothetical protein WCT53_06220 [Candidatus Gracilibacteria bacterium]
MIKIVLVCIIIIISPVLLFSEDRVISITAGPMIHWSFGGNENFFSIGIEAAYWDLEVFPKSIDLGFEFDKKSVRIYSELQTGLWVAGISSGIVLEFIKEEITVGFQGSVWGNFFGGVDVRYRRLNDVNFICPGIYGKYPFVWTGGVN